MSNRKIVELNDELNAELGNELSDEKEPNTELSIAFLIMLKNEENHIIPTLESGKKICREYFYLDTGSTDNTERVVKDWCKKNNKKLYMFSQSFVDFSTNRNHLLEEFVNKSTCFYALLFDAGDILFGEENVIPYIKTHPNFDRYEILMRWFDIEEKSIIYYASRLISKSNKIEYRGRIHETLYSKQGVEITDHICDNSFGLFQDRRNENSKERYLKDIEILKKDVEQDENNTRARYYLANSYFFSDLSREAIPHYLKRIEMSKKINEGVNEEVFNSYLRIAKCYYFLQDWDNTFLYLWKSWEYYHDAEPMLILASHYLQNLHDFPTAYHLTKLACEVVVKSEDKLMRNENIYEFFRWYEMARLAQEQKDFNLVNECAEKALVGGKNIYNKKKINEMLLLYLTSENALKSKYIDYTNFNGDKKPLIVIFGGWSYKKWNGDTQDIGGSETSAIQLAENLTEKYSVIIVCDTDKKITVNNVEYRPIEEYNSIITTYNISNLIVLRFAEYLRYGINISSTWIWLQDIMPIGYFALTPLLSHIIVLTEFHKKKLINSINSEEGRKELEKKILVLGNNIKASFIMENEITRKPFRFIYSSDPSRGLENVVNTIILLHEKHQEVELYIYSDFDNEFVKSRIDIESLKEKIKSHSFIHNCGRVSKDTLGEEMRKSTYWLYTPSANNFEETYCITALEMQACGVVCITDGSGSLDEVVGNRGIKLNSIDPKHICSIIEEEFTKKSVDTKEGLRFAKDQVWEKNVKIWEKELENSLKKQPTTMTTFLYLDNKEDKNNNGDKGNKSNKEKNKGDKNEKKEVSIILPFTEIYLLSQIVEERNGVANLIKEESTENTIFLDVGGSFGVTSIMVSDWVKKAYICDEKEKLTLSRKNIENNKNIEVVEISDLEKNILSVFSSDKTANYILKIDEKWEKLNKDFIHKYIPVMIAKVTTEEQYNKLKEINYELILIDEGFSSNYWLCLPKNMMKQFIKKYKEKISVCDDQYIVYNNIHSVFNKLNL